MLGFYILEVFGLKHCVKTPQCIFKNGIDASPASVLSTQMHPQVSVPVLEVYLQAHCFYMLVLLIVVSLSNMSFKKLSFGLEGRLCNRASINLFVNQNQRCLVPICTWPCFFKWKLVWSRTRLVCGVSITFEAEVVTGFPVLIMGERSSARCLLLACCNSLESLSYIEGVGLCASASTSKPVRWLSVSLSKLRWNYWFDVLMM